MIEVQTITVKLGEKEYTIREAPHLRASAWRRRLMEEVKPIFDQVANVADIQFETPADLLKLAPLAEQLFVEGVDQIFDLLITYSPELEADREYIEANAGSRQIFAAFQQVIKLADFFDLIPQIRRSGLAGLTGTLSNSPSPNGAVHSSKRKRSQRAK
jgi:hypothetical protein